MISVDSRGYWVNLGAFSPAVQKALSQKARVYAAVDDKSPLARRAKASGRTARGPSFVVTKTEGEYTWIPRTWIEDMPEFIRYRVVVHEHRRARIEATQIPPGTFTPTYTLKPNQLEVLAEVASYGAPTSGCLALHTGFGKTVVAIELIRRLNVRTLWLSHTSQLIRQFAERVQGFLGVTVGELGESDGPIVSCTIQSLLRREYPADFFDSFGLVIIDECHHMGAETFSSAFHKVGGIPHTIGLSATLERKDGLACVFQWAIGRVLTVRELVVTRKPLVRVVQGNWPVEIVMNRAGDPMFSQAITDLTRVDAYNQTILEVVAGIFRAEPERRVLLLTDRKEHIAILDAMIGSCPAFEGISVGPLHGNLTARQMDQNLGAKFILATYGVAGEGFDCPGLNCVVMATPRNDIRQSVGRILGERVTSLQPLIVDIRNMMGLFCNQGRERIKYYHASGFDVRIERAPSARDEPDEPSGSAAAAAAAAAPVNDDIDGFLDD